MILKNTYIQIFLALFIAVIFVMQFSEHVPFDMDEFYQYNTMASRVYPLNRFNIIHENAWSYDLAPFGKFYLPLRSFHYTGTLPSILYYPLFKIWQAPHSARLFGILLLMLQAYLLRKLFGFDFLLSFIALLLFMPYAFQHTADTGPISLQTTSIFIILYLLKKWKKMADKSKRSQNIYPAIIGLILFLGAWTKLVYFSLLPAIFIMIFVFMPRPKLKYIAGTTVLLISFAIPAFILINSADRSGYKYFMYFFSNRAIKDKVAETPLKSRFEEITCFFTNPTLAAHKIFVIDKTVTPLGILFISNILIFLIYGLFRVHKKPNDLKAAAFYFFLFLFSLLTFYLNPKAWAMHHIVLAFPFLILAVSELIKSLPRDKVLIFLASVFCILNIYLYSGIAPLKIKDADHPGRLALNKILNERFAKDYVFVVIDWGFYFMQALYGAPDQCVVYCTPVTGLKYLREVDAILTHSQRKVLFIGKTNSDSNLRLIQAYYPGLKELKTDEDTGLWRIWYE